MTRAEAVQQRCEAAGKHSREHDLLARGIVGLLADEPCHYSPLVLIGGSAATAACLEEIARLWACLPQTCLHDRARGSHAGQSRHAGRGTSASRKTTGRSCDQVLFLDAVSLAADLEAATGDDLDRIHRRWTRARLLLIDGVGSVAGPPLKPQHVEVLPHLLDRAADAGSRLVIALARERSPSLLPEPIRSRLEAGLVVALPDLDLAPLINDQSGIASGQRLTARRIVTSTASHFGLVADDLVGPSRRKTSAIARGVAMHVIRELLGESLADIGRHFGGRDHTTVLHAIRVTRRRCEQDAGLAADLESVVRDLASR